jgi:hypothetical protein
LTRTRVTVLRCARAWMFAALALTLPASRAMAQSDLSASAPPAPTERIPKVTADLGAGAFDRGLPFDVPFFLTGRAPAGTLSLDVQYAVVPRSGDTSQLVWMPSEAARWSPGQPSTEDQAFLVLVRVPLEASRRYVVRFAFRNVEPSMSRTVIAEGRTAQKNYVSVDAGLLYAGTVGIGALYVGGNVYFRPVNKDAPLSEFGGLGRRLALTVGATVSSVTDEENHTRSGLFWNQALVLGAGYRLTSSIRGGAGALIFREANPNPLISRQSATATWYASLSFDLDLLKD